MDSANHHAHAAYACPICTTTRGSVHAAREMMLGTKDLFHYFECSGCGCLSLIDPPADFSPYYPCANYYSFVDKPPSVTRKIRDRIYLSKASFLVRWRPRTDLEVIRNIELTKEMSLLDVGCGVGQLIADLRALGYSAEGIDPFVPEDITDNFGTRVRRKYLHEVSALYDVIIFRHSLEHMDQSALHIARTKLKPGGRCVVCIPLIGWAWQRYGTNWVQLDAPRHLFIHSRRSFELLAAASGFRVDRMIYDSNSLQFWASDLYEHDISLVNASPPKGVTAARLSMHAYYLNARKLGDSARFYLVAV